MKFQAGHSLEVKALTMKWREDDHGNEVDDTLFLWCLRYRVRTVRWTKATLAMTGDLAKKSDLVMFVENNAWYCNTEMSFRYVVNMKVVLSQKL